MAKQTNDTSHLKATKAHAHALYRESFPAFLRKAFPWLHNGKPIDENWHLDAVAYKLQQVHSGKIDRLIINLPPRGLKTFITSVAWPLWQLGRDPSRKILVVSHTLKLSQAILSDFRKLLAHGELATIFPSLKNAVLKETEDTVQLIQGGSLTAVSVGSHVTGTGGDLIIIDDPSDASDALSEGAIDAVNDWVDSTLSTRLNNPATDPMVLVMQRLAVNDMAAHFVSQGGWTQLSLPAIATKDESFETGPGEFHHRKKGELLHPSRYPESYLQKQKRNMGHNAFQAQFQQDPIPFGGGVIDVSKFGTFKELPKAIDYAFLSVDAASGLQSGSYSVIQLWYVSDGCLYLYSQRREYLAFPDLKHAVIKIAQRCNVRHIVIEYASSGMALVEELHPYFFKRERFDMVQSFKPRHSKAIRMDQALVWVDAKRVFLPESAPFLSGLVAELRAFPNGAHDDQVDALSQAVWWHRRKTESTLRVNAYRIG